MPSPIYYYLILGVFWTVFTIENHTRLLKTYKVSEPSDVFVWTFVFYIGLFIAWILWPISFFIHFKKIFKKW